MTLGLVAAAIAALLLPARADDGRVTQRVSTGTVTAVLTYMQQAGAVRGPELQISRAGRVVHDEQLRRVGCPDCPGWRFAGGLVLRDLDADGEPELAVDVYTGGAHCCTYSLLYRYDAASGRYAASVRAWGNAGYVLSDLDRDGRPELASRDDRFAAAFTPYAASASPLRVWRYERGRLIDVTRRFRAELERDSAVLWRDYLRARRREPHDVRGLLAAWCAEQVLLGRAPEAWRRLDGALRRGELGRARSVDGYPAGRRYLGALRAFLRRAGYLR
jgi:hypothetical protein